MKKKLLLVWAMAALYAGCSKNNDAGPVKNGSFKISLSAPFVTALNETWMQVLGGKALVQFDAAASDTLTAVTIKDSLNLKDIAAYKRQLTAGNYDVTLKTQSKAVADTFIRFVAGPKKVEINKDQVISLTATTNDAVITISKKQVDSSIKPSFTPTGTVTPYQFGLSNDYYFIYVKDATGGRIQFTETTTGNLYLKDITVAAGNQYDIAAILNSTGVSIHSTQLYLKPIL